MTDSDDIRANDAGVASPARSQSKGLSLQRKVTYFSLGATVGTLLLACAVLVLFDLTSFREHLSRDLTLLADVIADSSESALIFDVPAAAVDTLSALRVQPAITTSCIYNEAGALFAEYHRAVGETTDCPAQAPAIGYLLGANTVVAVTPIALDGEVIGSVYIQSDLQEQFVRLRTFGLAALVILAVSAVVVFSGTTWFIAKTAVDPINALRRVALDFGSGNLKARANFESDDEIGELATVFDTMADRLGASMATLSTRNREFEEKNQALNAALEALEQVSLTDPLTGANNRRFLKKFMHQETARIHRHYHHPDDSVHRDAGFILLDADHFKSINDSYGHEAGDLVLKQIVQVLKDVCRETDWIVRWGGEEFVVVCRFATRSDLQILAERIRRRISEYNFDIGQGKTTRRTCSLGVTPYPFSQSMPTALSWEETLNLADIAMYRAKKSGRNAWIYLESNSDQDPQDLHGLAVTDLAAGIADGLLSYAVSDGCQEVDWG